jgi:hypothetical protein
LSRYAAEPALKIEYENYVAHEPRAVSWVHDGKKVLQDFPLAITAVYSEPLQQVVVELFALGKLRFFNPDGSVASEKDIPALPGYEYRGLNRNSQSKTGIALLFNPVAENTGNESRDMEQYELLVKGPAVVGKKLGIYR